MTVGAGKRVAPAEAPSPEVVLLTGASGYIGGRLLHRLEAEARRPLRCMTRRPAALASRAGVETEVLAGDVFDPQSLASAMRGVETAYYLVHSMGASGNFEALDRVAASNFAAAARRAGVRRLVYLGGLGDGRGLSLHLASRQEVGEILRSSGVPTIEFRASIVIGSGSASYEIVRALVETLPVMVARRWLETAAQPIAVEDVVEYLVAALDYDKSAVFEIGGRDRVTYGEILREYARQRGLRRRLLPLPVLSPRMSGLCLGLLTPVYGRVAAAMVDGLRNETVVRTDAAVRAFPVRPRSLSDAIGRALVNEDREFAETRWSDALPIQAPLGWSGISFGRRQVCSRASAVSRPTEHAFEPIQRIGGRTGWYAANWFWRARGLLDTLRGGVGLRRGRRDPKRDASVEQYGRGRGCGRCAVHDECSDEAAVDRAEPGRDGDDRAERSDEVAHDDHPDRRCVPVSLEGGPQDGVVEGVVSQRPEELPVPRGEQPAGFLGAFTQRVPTVGPVGQACLPTMR